MKMLMVFAMIFATMTNDDADNDDADNDDADNTSIPYTLTSHRARL